jgi:hypothetical protein
MVSETCNTFCKAPIAKNNRRDKCKVVMCILFFRGHNLFENVFTGICHAPMSLSLQNFTISWSSSVCVAGISFHLYWLGGGGGVETVPTTDRKAWPSFLISVPCFDGYSFPGTSWDSPSLSPRCSTSSIQPCSPSGLR